MTRRTQNSLLTIVVITLAAIIALALVARLYASNEAPIWAKLYDFIKDMSLLIATIAVAYLANIYQRRQQFLQSLRGQWREIVEAKSAITFYCNRENPTLNDYLATSQQLSECIDNMRIVYSNVGETEECIGLFPYAPLHRMRQIMEEIDPRKGAVDSVVQQRALGQVMTAFSAVREHFLDEFDIEEPTRPILVYNMMRLKKPGATSAAKKLHDQQEEMMKKQYGDLGHSIPVEPGKY